MVTPSRDAAPTVGFIDHYCWIYRSLFKEVILSPFRIGYEKLAIFEPMIIS